MSFTWYLKSLKTSGALPTLSDENDFHNITFMLTPMAAWGRALALIGEVPPAHLGLDPNTTVPADYDGWMVGRGSEFPVMNHHPGTYLRVFSAWKCSLKH